MGLFSTRKDPEVIIKEGLRHIRDLYAEILNIERKVSEDISVFFNYEGREARLQRDIDYLEKMPRAERIRRAREIMEREHRILYQEKKMLDDIRSRLHSVARKVHSQIKEIEKIESQL